MELGAFCGRRFPDSGSTRQRASIRDRSANCWLFISSLPCGSGWNKPFCGRGFTASWTGPRSWNRTAHEEWLESEDEMNEDPTSQVALGHASELNDDLGGPCYQEDKEKWTGNSNSTITPDGEDVFNGNPLGSAELSVFVHVWLNSEEQLEPSSSYIIMNRKYS
ncbi:uncharacterized protein LOC119768962 [Culex quinquefasciatus]|uniref:uncharacterized protein LOC119768962 n=1 Tax=Culex quinquefasciatus TaxID=7176 RepID=UPI0018E312CA|nr:uncharacterized protein LOC119768962 [Culex quinquefasciatus]